MKKTKRIFCAAAAVLLLLCSCGSGKADGAVSSAGTETDAPDPDGGGIFTVRWAETAERESLTRAIRLRDMEIANRLGTKVVYDRKADGREVLEATSADGLSGDSPDLVAGRFAETLAPLYAAGMLRRLTDACGKYAERSLAADGGAYFTTAPVPSSYGDVSCVLINGDIAERFHVTGAAEAVRTGEWTWDRLAAVDAVIPPGSELYRYAVADGSVGPSAVLSAGETVSEAAGGGITVKRTLIGGAERAIAGARTLLSDGKTCYTGEPEAPQSAAEDAAKALFSGSEALFLFCKTGDVPALRGTGTVFHILPYPGAAGNGGKSGADSVHGTAAAVPAGGSGSRGTVLPELCRLSEKYFLPEATDAFLAGPSSYDGESIEILSDLLSGRVFEPALAFAGEDGEELERILTRAATGRGTLAGWEMTAARLRAGVR